MAGSKASGSGGGTIVDPLRWPRWYPPAGSSTRSIGPNCTLGMICL
jgi:hypothetical protein